MIRMQVAIVALLTGMVSGISAAAAAFTCPGKSDVEGRITKYITAEYWTPAQRDIWKIKDVMDFNFGPIRTGQIGRRSVTYGSPKEVCPVRVEYTFVAIHNDGRRETTQMGAGKTHWFYQDEFGDLQFKID
jgi:hypothetical protein